MLGRHIFCQATQDCPVESRSPLPGLHHPANWLSRGLSAFCPPFDTVYICHFICQSEPGLYREQPCLASAFDWSKPTAYFFDQAASRHRDLLTAASDPNFRNFAVQHRWHEHSETALVSLLHACAGPKTIRLLNAVLSSLEDLEFIIVRLQTALPALPALEMPSHEPVDLISCSQT